MTFQLRRSNLLLLVAGSSLVADRLTFAVGACKFPAMFEHEIFRLSYRRRSIGFFLSNWKHANESELVNQIYTIIKYTST